MVPNISPNGRSFRGAGAYHLHDKPTATELRPRTAARVAFAVTRNLANEDAGPALDEMWRTAEDATHLKAASGATARGRKNDTPVKTISLAWAPGQMPTAKQMIAAADEFLRAMGWHQHQALYVAHSDTAHPHLHIILNRIHPETGRTLNDWQERRRAQQWALVYERQHGAILCEGRVLRHDGRAASPPQALPYPEAKLLQHTPRHVRIDVAASLRSEFRDAWAQHYRTRRRLRAHLLLNARAARRGAASLAREGDTIRAHAVLDRCQSRSADALRLHSARSTAIRTVQSDRLRRLTAPTSGLWRIAINTLPIAANDNADASFAAKNAVQHRSGARLHALALPRSPTPANPLHQLTAMLRSERWQLRAVQLAALALLRLRGRAGRSASALAHSEIATAFASRWAAINQMPAPLRAAAITALRAEQATALRTRLAYHLSRLLGEQRIQRLRLSALHLVERRALLHPHHQAWAAAAARLKPFRPATAPATEREGLAP